MSTIQLEPGKRLALLINHAVKQQASDIHIARGLASYLRVDGELAPLDDQPWTEPEITEAVAAVIGESGCKLLGDRGAVDGAASFQIGNTEQRLRYNAYRSQGQFALAMRRLENTFRSLSELGLDDRLYQLCNLKEGLVLVAGPTGSGKSTTLATLIDRINNSRSAHIITIEDPIEYLHTSRQSLIHQRQLGLDTPGFHQAVIDAMRQDPDVILVGELRELETIRTALAAAETGHLVFATVHAADAVGTVERIVNVFPGNEQALIRQTLSHCLRGIIAQHLLPAAPKYAATAALKRILASEVLLSHSAVANLIATSNFTQLRSIIETSSASGMYTLDACLARLWRDQRITETVAKSLARNPQMLFELARVV